MTSGLRPRRTLDVAFKLQSECCSCYFSVENFTKSFDGITKNLLSHGKLWERDSLLIRVIERVIEKTHEINLPINLSEKI